MLDCFLHIGCLWIGRCKPSMFRLCDEESICTEENYTDKEFGKDIGLVLNRLNIVNKILHNLKWINFKVSPSL